MDRYFWCTNTVFRDSQPFLSLTFAAFLSEKTVVAPKTFLTAIFLVLPIFFLVYFQPDLGSAVLYLLVALFALLIDGYPYKWFGFLFLPIILLMPIIWKNCMPINGQEF